MCGWSIDHLIWHIVRDRILKDRYAGCCYSMASSLSPVIIRHRKPLTGREMKKISKLFPKWIRVEFQETDKEGEAINLYGRGDFIMYGDTYGKVSVPVELVPTQVKIIKENKDGLES